MPPHSSTGGAERVAAVDDVPDERADDADAYGTRRRLIEEDLAPRRTTPAVPVSSPGHDAAGRHRRLERAAGDLAPERHEQLVAGLRHAAADHHHLGVEDVEQVGDAGAEELRGVVHHLERELVAVVRGLVDGLRGDLRAGRRRPVRGSRLSAPASSSSTARSAMAGPDAYASRQP